MIVKAAAAALSLAFTSLADAAADERIRDALETELAAHKDAAPGAAGAVLFDGSALATVQIGVKDKRRGNDITDATRFFSGSIGKTIAAAVTVKLINDGLFSLDDPIENYLGDRSWYPSLQNNDRITVRMLLNHAAGVPSYLESKGFAFSLRNRRNTGYIPDELISFVAAKEPAGEPGQHFAYSDTHYIMLGLIIEQASGRKFYDLAREIVLDPMGLENTTPLVGKSHPRLANGYEKSGFLQQISGVAGPAMKNGELKFIPDYEWTGGGFVTTPADLAALFTGLFSSDDFADIRAVMTAPENMNTISDNLGYGLGVYINRRRAPDTIYSHGGDFRGYRSFVLYSERNRVAIAIQANAKHYEPVDVGFGVFDRITGTKQ